MNHRFPLTIAGEEIPGEAEVEAFSILDGSKLGGYTRAGSAALPLFLDCAAAAFLRARALHPAERAKLLSAAAARLRVESDGLADLLCRETGKPIALALGEIKSATGLLQAGAKECVRQRNIIEPMFVPVGSLQRMNMIRRFPRGVVLSAVPFTNPVSLCAHQLAAAAAAGTVVVQRPPTGAALSVLRFADIVGDAMGEIRWFSVLPMDYDLFYAAIDDPRVAMLSYFGSKRMASKIAERAGNKHVSMNIFGDAAAIVMPDCDVKYAAGAIARGAFAGAGQSCFAIENVLVHDRIYPQFRQRMVDAVELDVKAGDPLDPGTLVGPMTYKNEAERLADWISRAKSAGARVVAGGDCEGALFQPTLIEDLPQDFIAANPRPMGPVAVMHSVDSLDAAVKFMHATGSDFIAALFSRDQEDGLYLLENLNAGTIIMNEYPLEIEEGVQYRSASAARSGLAGLRWAVEEMTAPRDMLFNNYWGA
ncbi:MAG: aldehyde dehydrogenase family protein [bacterium]|jgi:acyl-CoA reductase-like NAD-dependent aldehyde dehydrogenase